MKKLYSILLLLVLLSCGSSKKSKSTQELRLEKLEETSKKINEKLETQIKLLEKATLKNIHLKPLDPKFPSSVIFNGDTLKSNNAEVNINEEEILKKSEENTIKETSQEDNSKTELDLDKQDSNKQKETKGFKLGIWGYFWIFFILILIAAYLYFRKKISFLP